MINDQCMDIVHDGADNPVQSPDNNTNDRNLSCSWKQDFFL